MNELTATNQLKDATSTKCKNAQSSGSAENEPNNAGTVSVALNAADRCAKADCLVTIEDSRQVSTYQPEDKDKDNVEEHGSHVDKNVENTNEKEAKETEDKKMQGEGNSDEKNTEDNESSEEEKDDDETKKDDGGKEKDDDDKAETDGDNVEKDDRKDAENVDGAEICEKQVSLDNKNLLTPVSTRGNRRRGMRQPVVCQVRLIHRIRC
jgi:hypothetical protein